MAFDQCILCEQVNVVGSGFSEELSGLLDVVSVLPQMARLLEEAIYAEEAVLGAKLNGADGFDRLAWVDLAEELMGVLRDMASLCPKVFH